MEAGNPSRNETVSLHVCTLRVESQTLCPSMLIQCTVLLFLKHSGTSSPSHERYDSSNLLEVLFTCRGSVFPKVVFRSALCAGLGGLAYWLSEKGFLTDANVDLHTYVGVILGLLLVFRTNISCECASLLCTKELQ